MTDDPRLVLVLSLVRDQSLLGRLCQIASRLSLECLGFFFSLFLTRSLFDTSSFIFHLLSNIVLPLVHLTLWPGQADGEDFTIGVFEHGAATLVVLGKNESIEATEVLGVAPGFNGGLLMAEKVDTEVRPGVLVLRRRPEVVVGEYVAEPIRDMEDVLKCHGVTLSTAGISLQLEVDCTNASDKNLATVGDSQDVRLEGDVCLESCTINCYVDVGCCREDPVVALLLLRLLGRDAVRLGSSVVVSIVV
jgi:hypothetical protein